MKNIILTIGGILIVFNTLLGIIIEGYNAFNFLMVDFSILLSVGFVYYLSSSATLDDAYSIGLSFVLIFTGLVRALFCLFLEENFSENWLLLGFVGVLLIEVLGIVIVKVLNNK